MIKQTSTYFPNYQLKTLTETYDDNITIHEENEYFPNGDLKSTTEITTTETSTVTYTNMGKIFIVRYLNGHKHYGRWDKQNRVIYSLEHYAEKSFIWIRRKYHPNGKIRLSIQGNETGIIDHRHYDEHGCLITNKKTLDHALPRIYK